MSTQDDVLTAAQAAEYVGVTPRRFRARPARRLLAAAFPRRTPNGAGCGLNSALVPSVASLPAPALPVSTLGLCLGQVRLAAGVARSAGDGPPSVMRGH
jgi:hypothetical protein